MADPVQTTPPGSPGSTPVPSGAAANPSGAAAAGPSARETVVQYGGDRGGKSRADGLTPGSPEADAADRKREAERKRLARQAKKQPPQQQPPPLPSVGLAAAAGMEGQAPAASGVVVPMPGAPVPPVIPWDPESLKEVFGLVIPTAEEMLTGQISSAAEKARLPVTITKEVEQAARWTANEKKALETFAPRATAKLLNRLHVPAGTQDELVLFTVLAKIGLRHTKLLKRLAELGKAANAVPTKAPEKKEAAA